MVSLSPFLGLFGTVWGVMMAFCGIAAAGKPDFFALAPGVAGALLTTVAGLVVAIPSLVGYNMLNGSIRQLTNMMDNFTEEFMVRLKLEQLELEKNISREQ
jgi:biopolymer transport protein TolQ